MRLRILAWIATPWLILLLAAGTVTVISRPAPAAPSAATANGVVNVTATLVTATQRSLRPRGRRSDATEQKWRLNDRNGRAVGSMLLGCRWIVPRARLCAGEVHMPLGTMTIAGSSPTPLEGEFAVTGGTGFYQGGRGVMQFTAIGLRKQVLFITVTT